MPRSDCTLCGACVAVCRTGARRFGAVWYTPEQLAREAAEDKPFYRASGGGVTLSGGECMLYPDFMARTLCCCKELELNTAVDTCGAVPWSSFERILPFADLFLYDVKVIDSERHNTFTGAGNDTILNNLKKLCFAKKSVILRIPLIPGYTDSPADIRALGAFIITELRNRIVRVELLPYNPLAAAKYTNCTAYTDGGPGQYPLSRLAPPAREHMNAARDLLAGYGITVFHEAL